MRELVWRKCNRDKRIEIFPLKSWTTVASLVSLALQQDIAEIRFFAVRSLWFRVSGYCSKWWIQGFTACSQETQYLASILSNTFVKCVCGNISCTLVRKMELALEEKFYLDFHWVTRPWRRTLTNGSDVKYVFPLTNGSDVKYVFPLTNRSDVKYVFSRCPAATNSVQR